MSEPQRPADRRPNDEPFFVPKVCQGCGAKLVYSYLLDAPDTPEHERWYGEFECPQCRDGLVLDVPKGYI
ncbi:hypothetical protein [Alicyclobacillus tolerans]|uniref:Uncharacterized protein n=1 Tax=Alicyclobacillus tolerans TaxID=90970 RepID=A0A1M6LRE6_9BACL|nr:hypothetical protein [Alicyclobacillus montanus]SHJ73672.1 hypothetical protein SAMN05443507_10354 [Alicyclobacillus montanus]